jgi:hypothetical protein
MVWRLVVAALVLAGEDEADGEHEEDACYPADADDEPWDVVPTQKIGVFA